MAPPPPRDDGGYARQLVTEAIRFARDAAANDNATRDQLTSAVRSFVDHLTFSLDIPGQHYGGLSNQELFDVLAAQGRDFAAPSRELDEHIRTQLIYEFADYPHLPSDTLFRQVVGDIVLEWVVSRMEGEVHDVPLTPLSSAWATYKRVNGFDDRIGVMRGDLLEAVKSAGVIAR